jgi:adenylate cyclase
MEQQQGRQTTVLFADVSGSTRLYETEGDAAALEAIGRCIDRLSRTAEKIGGRVLKTMGDEVMVLFATADQAACAASEMHAAMEQMPALNGHKFGIRIGFHTGPVIQRDNDVFGDTVNLAARMVEQAQKGQIITSQETSLQLSAPLRAFARKLYPISIKGKSEEVSLCEIEWRPVGEATGVEAPKFQPRPTPAAALRLKYRDQQIVRRRDTDYVTIGRDPGCGLQVIDQNISRRHCTIERRDEGYVLKDHSTNGTYVTIYGDTEILIARDEVPLRKHGWLALGQPIADTREVVAYFLEA